MARKTPPARRPHAKQGRLIPRLIRLEPSEVKLIERVARSQSPPLSFSRFVSEAALRAARSSS
jgi:hypothetical protein